MSIVLDREEKQPHTLISTRESQGPLDASVLTQPQEGWRGSEQPETQLFQLWHGHALFFSFHIFLPNSAPPTMPDHG